MKTVLATSAAAVLLAQSALAGGMAEPVPMAPVEIVEDTAGGSSNAGLVVPLILIALIAAAVADSGDGESMQPSDARLKGNAVPVGVTPGGLTLYEYSYLGLPGRYVGVMAQEVLAHTPEAVVPHPAGFLMVDYRMIDADFAHLN